MACRASSGSGISSRSRGGTGWSPRTTTTSAKTSSNGAAAAGVPGGRPGDHAAQEPARPVHAQEPDRLQPALAERRLARAPGRAVRRRTGPSASSAAAAGLRHRGRRSPAARRPRARCSWARRRPAAGASCPPRTTAISGPWSSAMLSWISNPVGHRDLQAAEVDPVQRPGCRPAASHGPQAARPPQRGRPPRSSGVVLGLRPLARPRSSSSSGPRSSLTSSSRTSGSALPRGGADGTLSLLPALDHGVSGPAAGPGPRRSSASRGALACPPVDPNPPSPRADPGRVSTSWNTGGATRWMTSCAIRSPRWNGTASAGSVLSSVTLISPRYPASTVPGAFTIVTPCLAASPDRGMHERGVPVGQRDGHPGRHHRPLRRAPSSTSAAANRSTPGVPRMGPGGQRQIRVQPLDEHVHRVRAGVHR